jgi:(2Fe-2S) ferredoxin
VRTLDGDAGRLSPIQRHHGEKYGEIYQVMGRKSARRGVDEMLANGERVDARRKTNKSTKR